MEVTTEASIMGSTGHQNKPYGHEIVNLKKKRSRSYDVTERKRKKADHIMLQKEKDRESKRVEVIKKLMKKAIQRSLPKKPRTQEILRPINQELETIATDSHELMDGTENSGKVTQKAELNILQFIMKLKYSHRGSFLLIHDEVLKDYQFSGTLLPSAYS